MHRGRHAAEHLPFPRRRRVHLPAAQAAHARAGADGRQGVRAGQELPLARRHHPVREPCVRLGAGLRLRGVHQARLRRASRRGFPQRFPARAARGGDRHRVALPGRPQQRGPHPCRGSGRGRALLRPARDAGAQLPLGRHGHPSGAHDQRGRVCPGPARARRAVHYRGRLGLQDRPRGACRARPDLRARKPLRRRADGPGAGRAGVWPGKRRAARRGRAARRRQARLLGRPYGMPGRRAHGAGRCLLRPRAPGGERADACGGQGGACPPERGRA